MHITPEIILKEIQDRIEERKPIPESWWLDAAQKLNVFWGVIADDVADLKQQVARMRVEWLDKGTSAVEARIRVDTTDIARMLRQKESKLAQISEFIRITKKRVQMSQQERQEHSQY